MRREVGTVGFCKAELFNESYFGIIMPINVAIRKGNRARAQQIEGMINVAIGMMAKYRAIFVLVGQYC